MGEIICVYVSKENQKYYTYVDTLFYETHEGREATYPVVIFQNYVSFTIKVGCIREETAVSYYKSPANVSVI